MTRARAFGSDVAFCSWLRNCPQLPSIDKDDGFGFVATDVDLIIHRYMTNDDTVGTRMVQGIMHLEVKTRGGEPLPSQIHTLSVMNLFCGDKFADGINIRNFGVFVLSMSGLTPDDSCSMRWGVLSKRHQVASARSQYLKWINIDRSTLIAILRFELHPRSLTRKPFRRHHKTSEFIEEVKTPLGFIVLKPRTKRS